VWRTPDRRVLRVAALLVLASLTAGCPPTLSRPHSLAAERALAAGDRASHHGRVGEAVDAYRDAAQQADRRVDREEALYRLARVFMRAHRYAGAVMVLDRIAAARPVSRRTVRALYDASRLRIEHLGERAQGVAGLTEVATHHGDSGLAARALYHLLALRRAQSDASALRWLAELEPQVAGSDLHDDVLMAHARLALELHDTPAARRSFERIVAEHPYPQGHRWDEALIALSALDREAHQPEAAIARLRQLTLRHDTTSLVGSYTLPAFAQAQLELAHIYRDDMHDADAAAAEYARLIADYPRSLLRDDALLEWAQMELDGGNPDAGCARLERLLSEFEVGRARRRAQTRLEADCATGTD